MKLIQAMKLIKANDAKIVDLQNKIALNCANLSNETPMYGTETTKQINSWLQTCLDLTQENAKLHTQIQRTNLATQVTMQLGDKSVTKSIAEWIWRRRLYAAVDLKTVGQLTDRKLKEGTYISSTNVQTEVRIQRHFDPVVRDKMAAVFLSEAGIIDSDLEVVNAVTDLLE